MRIVYIDEAGTSNKTDEPFLVVAGVLVHGDHQLNKLNAALQDILRKHIPEADRDKALLHATDIYSGRKYFDPKRKPEWTIERRMAILDDLAKLPVDLNLKVVFNFLDKVQFPPERLDIDEPGVSLKALSVALVYVSCLIEVDQWFRDNAKMENCFVVLEPVARRRFCSGQASG